ncbi:putative E3 ubiquitin-protein ligase LIN-1 isoform X2 [Phragmites australis]|uniref:putative E3 ubiquitin-protein ligase LIN-1 isoform X2 n=1 Tax=Phragmites australis TaxID=29695 RepID=UPI002D772A9E|nr:putative E3 ubiquitin-protein ligase LIN-1 isoform X2 [Phragmites australis]
MMSSPPSSSLRDLLARERTEVEALPAPHQRAARWLQRAASRSRSSRHASLPPEEAGVGASGDDGAVDAVVAVLSGYAGRFLKDSEFRRGLREKCAACLAPAAEGSARRDGAGHAVLANLELGIESIERLAADGAAQAPRDAKIRSLRNSIRLLSVVASLHAPRPVAAAGRAEGRTCGVPNSHLAACSQLYLSVVYKMERSDRVSARHLLQVFVDAPSLARKNLLPDLWDHVFLPHLLHLKVWFTKEADLAADWGADDRSKRMKSLQRLYNDHMDSGTVQFAMYYKEWLKSGADAPLVPSVPLPSMPGNFDACEKHSASVRRTSINRNLYNAVFGTALEQEDVKDEKLDDETELILDLDVELNDNSVSLKTEKLAHSKMGLQEKHSRSRKEGSIPETAPTPRKSYSFRLFTCQGDLSRKVINHPKIVKKEVVSVEEELDSNELTMTLERAISVVSNSDSLRQCEYAVHEVARACSTLQGDPNLVTWLSCPSFIQGLLEVTFTSKDDAVLESAILIMGKLVLGNEVIRQIMLNADPQLEVFLRLLRSNELFLKAAVVLYMMKPKAKQMLSLDWIPLVLHILECGDEVQFLCSVKCAPKIAAFYFLDQLLMGFDVDRNIENAKQMIALGGLDLLMSRLEVGDACESKICVSLLTSCIQADGTCRHYLADNLKKDPIVRLLAGNHNKASAAALNMMSELVCLNRTTKIVEFLKELKNSGCLNTMHILLVYLQQAPLVQQPLAAAMLLQLDLLGDPSQYSVYREEAIEAMVAALEHGSQSRKVQEQCARALLILAGRFSASGEPIAEAWLLKRAGLDDSLSESFRRTEIFKDKSARVEEEKVVEEWLKKLALMLLNSGSKRFLMALSNCISDGIPSLSRSCLITVTWMSSSLSPLRGCNDFQPLACSILAPKLLYSLNYDRVLEERVLASLSLLNVVRHPECMEKVFPLKKETIKSLQDLAEVTWTAKELLFACCR